MQIKNENLLDQFRGPGVCEWCRKRVKNREPHHIHTRGACRLDIRINLVALCSTFSGGASCHHKAHNVSKARCFLINLAASREGIMPEELVQEIHRLRRLPKGSDPTPILGERV